MLGVDSLQNQRVMFDFAKKTMSITPARKRERYWGPDAIVITGRNLYGRLILTNAQIDGQKIVVVLDTGSQVSIGNTALRRQLAARKRLAPTTPIELTSVTGGKMSADYTTVREIQIGGIRITDMPIGFADAHPFRQLELLDEPAFLLGMDVLRLFDRVSVDFARKQIRFLAPDASPRMIQVRMADASAVPALRGLAAGP
jgi:predicted aspartyl protease